MIFSSRRRLYYYDTSGRLSFVRFLEEIDDPKKHFEINWPLEKSPIDYDIEYEVIHFYDIYLKNFVIWIEPKISENVGG